MKRRRFIKHSAIAAISTVPLVKNLHAQPNLNGPYFTTGIKIGELSSNAAIVWARLTKDPVRTPDRKILPENVYLDEKNNEWHDEAYFKSKYKEDRPDKKVKVNLPAGHSVETLDGAVPGIAGEMRISHKKKNAKNWMMSDWQKVDDQTDYCGQFKLTHLDPNEQYLVRVEGKSGNNIINHIEGTFKTAPTEKSSLPVKFMVTTCHEYNDQDAPNEGGFKIFKHMQHLSPNFLVHTGDVIYHDRVSKNLALARWNWQKMSSLPNNVEFYKTVPCYFMKDDHDTWMNDCCRDTKTRFMGDFTFDQGLALFKQQVPSSEKPYRTFRWGKDLQIWMVDGREARVSFELPDGPDKTIWGKEQMNWFKETYNSSDAKYKILISATPIIGPDRPQKKDNHSNKSFAFEGDMIRNLIGGSPNTFVICGDRHWQYVSQHKKTGTYEFSCGPASDEHAGGWKKEDIYPEHQYLNIVGGFLQVELAYHENNPSIHFSHYSVDGKVLFEKNFS